MLPWQKRTAWCPRLASSNSCFHDDKQALTTSSYSYSHSVIVPVVCYHGNRAAKVCMIKSPVCCYSYRSLAGIQVTLPFLLMEWSVCHLLWGCKLAPCPDWETPHSARPLRSAALWVSVSGRETETVKQSYWHTKRNITIVTIIVYMNFSLSLVRTDTHTPAYVLARLSSSMQACKSAKARIPRQLVGWSWVMRNSQQAFLTSCNCSRPAAGKST